MSVQWQIALLLLSAFLSFTSVAYWTRLSRRDKEQDRKRDEAEKKIDQDIQARQDIVSRLFKLEASLAVIDQKVVPISTALQAILVKELTHYHTPIMDELMTRIGPPSTLSEEEEVVLTAALLERTQDMGVLISSAERDAAFILPAIMRRAKAECALLNSVIAQTYVLKFVTVENIPIQ